MHPVVTTCLKRGEGQTPGDYEENARGADISAAARVYLVDVADHVLILTEEIDMLRGTVENMINLVHPQLIVLLTSDFQYRCINTK